jgi:hypothetical protein
MIYQPLIVMFKAAMFGLMPARKKGLFGTPDAPVYFEAGDAVPWWVLCRWPLHGAMVFNIDVETYFDDGGQIVRPTYVMRDCLIKFDSKGWHAVIIGAPTHFVTTARPPKRSAISAALQWAWPMTPAMEDAG